MASTTASTTDYKAVLDKAAKRALGGGLPGAMAMGAQVTSLMWVRSVMNYQYRHGGTFVEAFRHLKNDGGLRRFYRGYGPALIQGPMSRFGDTAANAGVLAALDSMEETKDLNVGIKTAAASFTAGLWRIFLMPVDCLKTTLQVEGAKGLSVIGSRMATGGPLVLYHGALGAAAATMVGHFPWFATYNFLNERLPTPETQLGTLGRSAVMGFCSSVVSDCISNSLRVLKTTRQTHEEVISYRTAATQIIAKDGLIGLFGRGLKTRLLANGLNGVLFAVLWKYFERTFFSDNK